MGGAPSCLPFHGRFQHVPRRVRFLPTARCTQRKGAYHPGDALVRSRFRGPLPSPAGVGVASVLDRIPFEARQTSVQRRPDGHAQLCPSPRGVRGTGHEHRAGRGCRTGRRYRGGGDRVGGTSRPRNAPCAARSRQGDREQRRAYFTGVTSLLRRHRRSIEQSATTIARIDD